MTNKRFRLIQILRPKDMNKLGRTHVSLKIIQEECILVKQ